MGKIIPLTNATLKSFIRNKKSILLLIIAPLLLIGAIFLSFNPEGLNRVPVGVIDNAESLDVMAHKNTFFSYLELNDFDSLGTCLEELKNYRQYACIDIEEEDKVILNIHYDNTKEPVIWEILERIKGTIELMKREQSKESLESIFEEIYSTDEHLDDYKQSLDTIDKDLRDYIGELGEVQDKVRNAKIELSEVLDQMDSDVDNLRLNLMHIESRKNNLLRRTEINLERLESYASSTEGMEHIIRNEINTIRNTIDDYDSRANQEIAEANMKLDEYEQKSALGRGYTDDMQEEIRNIQLMQISLGRYEYRIMDIKNDVEQMQSILTDLRELSVDEILSPVIMDGEPTYIPDVDMIFPYDSGGSGEEQIEQVMKGLNMISLQTIFPTVLFLITLFLSLLISNFVCLNEVNSFAKLRVSIIRRVFFPEIISTFISSVIVVLIPLVLIICAGHYLFYINILPNFFQVFAILFLTSSVFIFMGMMLAYLIRKESITLLLTVFFLVLFIFLSGVILPLERMSPIANFVAYNLPIYLGLSSFNKLVFYSQSLSVDYLVQIFIWIFVLALATIIIKKVREG